MCVFNFLYYQSFHDSISLSPSKYSITVNTCNSNTNGPTNDYLFYLYLFFYTCIFRARRSNLIPLAHNPDAVTTVLTCLLNIPKCDKHRNGIGISCLKICTSLSWLYTIHNDIAYSSKRERSWDKVGWSLANTWTFDSKKRFDEGKLPPSVLKPLSRENTMDNRNAYKIRYGTPFLRYTWPNFKQNVLWYECLK